MALSPTGRIILPLLGMTLFMFFPCDKFFSAFVVFASVGRQQKHRQSKVNNRPNSQQQRGQFSHTASYAEVWCGKGREGVGKVAANYQ